MKNSTPGFLIAALGLLAGCGEETPPTPVDEFLDNRILLDAEMARCTQNRAETRYEQQCINAREAANTIARREEAQRRVVLEQQSESKRAALRRTQEAAEEARQRAAEAERLRKEAAYLLQFGGEPTAEAEHPATSEPIPPGVTFESADDPGNTGTVVEPASAPAMTTPAGADAVTVNAPQTNAEQAAVEAVPASGDGSEQDLQSVRDELRRRQE